MVDLAPLDFTDAREHRRKIAQAVNQALEGKVNSVGIFTLTINVATTVLDDTFITPNSAILVMPATANAAGELATMYFGTVGNQTATITHANNAQADRTFRYVVLG